MAPQIVFTLSVAAAAAVITSSALLSSLASLDVAKVMSGEVWRVITGHLSHLTWRQYAVDSSAFVILYTILADKAGLRSSILLCAFSALAVSLVVVLAGVHQIYGGLSGLTYAGCSALIFLGMLERPRQLAIYIVGLLFLLYVIFFEGTASGVISVAREAHIAGVFAGLSFIVMRRLFSGGLQLSSKTEEPIDK